MYDIIIVGAGTAGLSAAIYGVRAGKKVLVFEEKSYGGQIVNTPSVENYPGIKNISGFEFATNLYEQAIELGAVVKYEKVLGLEIKENTKDLTKTILVKTPEEEYESKTLILATGAKNRPLGIEGEQEYIGRGLSYCATCDGMFFRGKDVAVVGGGNTALEDAGFLSNYCNRVYVIHRRNEFRGEEHLVQNLRTKSNIEFVLESKVIGIEGEGSLKRIKIINTNSKEEKVIDIAGLFVAIGQMPDNSAFSDVVSLDGYGYIHGNEDCKTNVPGIFVAGDCRTKTVRQLTTAASDGAVAALAACEYIG
ncbi:MAG: thioredoxin-disulfide reductase [Lachnospiraceae bacterium]|nr:thioredoxin-disulfide reductase [Lachnospiraceae bacterium]